MRIPIGARFATFTLVILLLTTILAFAPVQLSAQAAATAQQPDSAPSQYSLPADKLARATTLYHTELWMFTISTLYSLAVLLALLHFGIGTRFRELAERISNRFFLQALIAIPLILLTLRVSMLPLSIFGHHIGLAYGLSVQHWASWFGDWTKSTLIELVVGTFICFGVYKLMRRSPRFWWLWIWVISIPLTIFAVWIVPIALDPMFNKFQPLELTNPQLVQQLTRVVQKAGLDIPPSRMFEMKASEKVTTYNAYVTGVGSSKRIVVWDTTEREMTTPETLFIFGHELGHYVLDHIWKGIVLSIAFSFLGILIGRSILQWSLARRGDYWALRGINDLAGLPLLLLIFSALTLASMPIDSTISRYFEHEADVYGLEITHDINDNSPEVAAMSFQKLGEKSLDYPHPNSLYVFLTYSHPTIADRLVYALRYRPWEQQRPLQYMK
jgi:STE24 endopeptidase